MFNKCSDDTNWVELCASQRIGLGFKITLTNWKIGPELIKGNAVRTSAKCPAFRTG